MSLNSRAFAPRRVRHRVLNSTAILLCLAGPLSVSAQVWTGLDGTNPDRWNFAGNWDTNVVPDADTAVVDLPNGAVVPAGGLTLRSGTFTVNSLTIGDGYSLRQGKLNFDGANAALTINNTSGTNSLDSSLTTEIVSDTTFDVNENTNYAGGITLGAGTTLTTDVAAGVTLGLSGPMNGNGDLSNVGAGTLDLTGGQTFLGGTTQAAGTLSSDWTIQGLTVSGGTFNNSGTVTNTTAVNGGTVANTGTLTGQASVASGAALTTSGAADGGIVNNGGDVDVTGGTTGALTNNAGTLDITAGSTGAVTNAATGTNAGTIASLNNSSGSFTNTGIVSGTQTISGGTVRNQGAGDVQGATTIVGGTFRTDSTTAAIDNQSGGRLVVQANGDTGAVTNADEGSNAGTIASLNNTGGTFTNNGIISGTTTISGGTVENTGAGDMQGATTITTGGTLQSSAATGVVDNQSGGTLDLQSGGTSGAVSNAGTAQSAATVASLSNSGGTFSNTGLVSGTTTIDGGAVTNQAAGTLQGAMTVNASGTLSTSGTTAGVTNAGGTVNVTGGTVASLTNNAGTSTVSGGTISGATQVTNGTTVNASGGGFGSVSVTGAASTFNVTANTSAGGTFTSAGIVNGAGGAGGVTLTVTGGNTFTSTGALTANANGLTIVADTINIASGSTVQSTVTLQGGVNNSGTQDIDTALAGDLGVAAGGTTNVVGDTDGGGFAVTNDGTLNVNANVDLTNVGSLANNSTTNGLDLATGSSVQVNGAFTNNGTTTIASGATLSAQTIANQTGSITVAGTLSGTGNTLDNDGPLNVADGGTVEDAGDINNNAGGTITFAGDGTLNADNDNDGDALNNIGTISSTDGGSNTITLGDANADILNNNGGTITVGTTDSFIGTALTANNAGNLNIGTDGSFTAQTTNNQTGGVITIDGTLGGALAIADGTVNNNATGTISNDTTLTGGTLNTAGTVSGSITNTGGDVNVTGGTTQAVTNTTGNLVVSAGASTGAVINDDIASNAGTVDSLTNTGGTFDNTGIITNAATVDGGTVTNQVTGQINGTSTVNNGGTLNNLGTVADVTNNAGGTFTNQAGANADAVANAGTGSNAGTIDSLTNSANAFTNTGDISTTADVTGGTVTNTATGEIIGASTVDGGALINAGTVADVTNNAGGTFTNQAGANADAVANAGTGSNAGTIDSLANSGNTFSNTGDVSTTATVTGGDVTNTATGEIIGASNITGGSLTNAGTVADVTNAAGGTFTNQAGADAGAVANAGIGSNAGTIASLANTGGTFDNTNTVSGTTAVDGGDVTNSGTMTGTVTQSAGTFASTGTLSNNLTMTGGDATVSGTIDGSLNVGGTASVDVNAALSGLDAINITDPAASIDFTGGTTTVDALGAVGNDGTVTLNGGNLSGTGTFTNRADATLNIAAGSNLQMNLVNNSDETTNILAGTLTGDLNNNAGARLQLLGGAVITGNVTNVNTATLDMATDGGTLDATDVVTVNGDLFLSTGSVVSFGANVNDGTEAADVINVSGNVTLNGPTFDFSLTDPLVTASASGIPVLTYGSLTNNVAPTVGGDLAGGGAVVFNIVDDGAGTLSLQGAPNPAIGGVASGISLTQSLIGVIVNRPTSPFVTGLAIDDGNPCGLGTWGRLTGGRADAEGTSTTALLETTNEVNANYAGLQAGFDYSCSGGEFAGWDLAFGGIIGVNNGDTKQDVFSIDVTPELTNVIRNDFTQTYLGAYVTAARNRFVADLQFRLEDVDFDLRNQTVLNSATDRAVLFPDQSYSSKGQTLSGSVGYALPFKNVDGMIFATSAGFSISRTEVDDIRIGVDLDDDLVADAQEGVVVIDDIVTTVGFASATLARTQIAPTGLSALRYFGTLTYYQDFTSDTDVVLFTDATNRTNPFGSTASSLGSYGELSLGINYTRIIDPGNAGAIRQFDASVRLDARAGSGIDSYALTAQARLQF